MSEAQEPQMSDAEVSRAVVRMLTVMLDAAAAGEVDPDLVKAADFPIAFRGRAGYTPSEGPANAEDVRRMVGEAVQDATSQVESHYRKVVDFLVVEYLGLALAASDAGVDAPALLRESALRAAGGDDDPPLTP